MDDILDLIMRHAWAAIMYALLYYAIQSNMYPWYIQIIPQWNVEI